MTAPDKPPSLKRQYGSQDKSDPEWSPSEDNRAIAKVETPKKRKVNKFDASGWQKAEARRRQCEVMKVVMTQKTKLWSDVPCLVTRRGAAMDMVDVCHVLANTTNSLVLHKLEWAWGMKFSTLGVDTTNNLIMSVISQLHGPFDRGGFILLPDESFVARMMQAKDRFDVKAEFDAELYVYQLIPLPAFKNFGFRVYSGTYEIQNQNNTLHQAHFYPFDQLPRIQSHLKPHFATFNAGKKLAEIFGTALDQEFGGMTFTALINDASL